jgi:hypothetical protein
MRQSQFNEWISQDEQELIRDTEKALDILQEWAEAYPDGIAGELGKVIHGYRQTLDLLVLVHTRLVGLAKDFVAEQQKDVDPYKLTTRSHLTLVPPAGKLSSDNDRKGAA